MLQFQLWLIDLSYTAIDATGLNFKPVIILNGKNDQANKQASIM